VGKSPERPRAHSETDPAAKFTPYIHYTCGTVSILAGAGKRLKAKENPVRLHRRCRLAAFFPEYLDHSLGSLRRLCQFHRIAIALILRSWRVYTVFWFPMAVFNVAVLPLDCFGLRAADEV
jgi:hypothetical protein